MIKLDLLPEGKLYLRSLQVCFNWLSIGGEIKVKGGHTLSMIENGGIGFKANRWRNGGPEEEIVMQIDSDTSLLFLIDHARKMSEEDVVIMASNCALNSK